MTERARHKQAVRQAFDRAATSYDSAAAVQREICHRLAELAATHPAQVPPSQILDAGCGTGYGLRLLAQRYPAATRIALDFAPAMLTRAHPPQSPDGRQWAVCGDVESLPLGGASVGAVWSSLALQWCEPAAALGEFARVLRPGGAAWLATLGPRTLIELRTAFAEVDNAQHVIPFVTVEDWLTAAADAGFTVKGHSRSPAFAVAQDLRTLLRDIKAIGAHSVGHGRRRQPLGKAAWRTLENRYETHRRNDGLLPATYDVILLALQKPT